MKNPIPATQRNQNDSDPNRSRGEMQRRFVDLQFKRSQLEVELKKVNEVIISLGREMDSHFVYEQLYK